MSDMIRQASLLQSISIVSFLLIIDWIFQKQAAAFLVTDTKQQYTSWSSSRVRSCQFDSHRHQRLDHRGFHRQRCLSSSLCEDYRDDCDTLETLSGLLSDLLSANVTDAHPTTESDLFQHHQRQRKLLTTRLSNIHNDSGVYSKHIHINRTYVEKSTIVDAGRGLFVRKDCPKGTLLTCYPGDALIDLAPDGEDAIDIDSKKGEEQVTWGSHAKNITTMTHDEDGSDGDGNTNYNDASKLILRQEYMLRAIRDHWGIVAVPELFEDGDPSYLGHFANDGARHSPRCESELAAYVIESADKANAMHQPCEDCHMVTVATRNLNAGEEIFVTYGPEYWREQASFVPSSSSSQYHKDADHYEDFDDDDDDFDDSDFDFDYYDDEAESIVAEIISSSESTPESSSRGKGFG